MSETFVLDRVENPHPTMREHALALRRIARMMPVGSPMFLPMFLQWQGYLWAMCDATGEKPEDINAWLDTYDGTPVAIR